MGALAQSFVDAPGVGCKRQHQVGLAVVQQVGDLTRPIVGVDGHAAYAEAVERELVQDVLGPVLEKRGDPVAIAVPGGPVGGR